MEVRMATTKLSPVFDNFLDYLVAKATPHEILAFEVSEEEQLRAEELSTRHKEGTLSLDEAAELEQMVEFNLLVATLRTKSIKRLSI
jgi:hypothetical protein